MELPQIADTGEGTSPDPRGPPRVLAVGPSGDNDWKRLKKQSIVLIACTK